VRELIQRHEPANSKKIDKLLLKYQGEEGKLVSKLRKRYEGESGAETAQKSDKREKKSKSKKKKRKDNKSSKPIEDSKISANDPDLSTQHTPIVLNMPPSLSTQTTPIATNTPPSRPLTPAPASLSHQQQQLKQQSPPLPPPAQIREIALLLDQSYGVLDTQPASSQRLSNILSAYVGRYDYVVDLLREKGMRVEEERKEEQGLGEFGTAPPNGIPPNVRTFQEDPLDDGVSDVSHSIGDFTNRSNAPEIKGVGSIEFEV